MANKSRGGAGFNFTGPMAGLGNSVLGLVGIKKADRPKQQPMVSSNRSTDDMVHGMPLQMQLTLGARLPFCAFVFILGLFTYAYHLTPLLPWLVVFLCVDFALIVTWPPREIGHTARNFWDFSPLFSWLFAVASAVGVGLLNYGVIEAWVNTTFLREYRDVLPNTNPLAVSDAGILNFAKGTKLDTSSAAGYRFWLHNYCAAPVVGEDPMATPVGFWAVGVGCCASRGDFSCDSAGDESALAAMPLRPHNLGPEITERLNIAINMSAAANNLEINKERVFVAWQKDPHRAGKNAWWLATGIFLALDTVALCCCCACQSGLTHLRVMRQN